MVDGVLDIQSSRLRVTDEAEVRIEEACRGDTELVVGDEVGEGETTHEALCREHLAPSRVEHEYAVRLYIRPAGQIDPIELDGAVEDFGEELSYLAGSLTLYRWDTEEP